MVFNLSFGILIITTVIMSFFVTMPITLGEKEVRQLWRIFVISFSVVIYFNEPFTSTDLWRHYYCMDEIRHGVIPSMYSAEYLFIAFLWVITLIGKNKLLPSIVFLIVGFFIDAIVGEYKKRYEEESHTDKPFNSRILILYYFLVLAGMGIFSIVSGIRNALVTVIFVWVYLKFHEANDGKKRWYYIVGFLLGLIHIISYLLMVLVAVNVFLNRIQKRERLIVTFLIAYIGIKIAFQSKITVFLAGLLPGQLGNLIFAKVTAYSSIVQEKGGIKSTFGVIHVIILLILLLSLTVTRLQESLVYLLFFVSLLGGLNVSIAARLIMATVLVMMPQLVINDKRIKGGVNIVYRIAIYIVCLYSCLFSFYSMVAHMTLNGINYRNIIANLLGI